MSLPTIEMPEPEPAPVEVKIAEQIIDNIENRDNKSDKELVVTFEDEAEISEEEEVLEKDVFKEVPIIKPVQEEEIPEIKPARKKYERTKPMSQKQKLHLEKIRKIASEKRRVVREEKAKAKEDLIIQKAEAKIKKQKEKEEQDLRDKFKAEHDENLKIASDARYSQGELEEAMLNAVSTYDTLRKERKVEKKARLAKEQQKTNQQNMIRKAIQPQSVDPNEIMFAHCFR